MLHVETRTVKRVIKIREGVDHKQWQRYSAMLFNTGEITRLFALDASWVVAFNFDHLGVSWVALSHHSGTGNNSSLPSNSINCALVSFSDPIILG